MPAYTLNNFFPRQRQNENARFIAYLLWSMSCIHLYLSNHFEQPTELTPMLALSLATALGSMVYLALDVEEEAIQNRP